MCARVLAGPSCELEESPINPVYTRFFKAESMAAFFQRRRLPYSALMRPVTFLLLIGALVLALAAIPLTIAFAPAGIACCLGSLLLALLAVPDLSRQDKRAESLAETYSQ